MPLEVRHPASHVVLHRNAFVAEDFDVPDLHDAAQELTTPYGTATLHHWYFEGIRLGYAHWRFHEPLTTEWRSDLDVVQLHVNLRGRTEVRYEQLDPPIRLSAYQHNLAYGAGRDAVIRYEELEAESFMLQLTRPVFLSLTAQTGPPLAAFRARVAAGEPALLDPQSRPLTLPMHHLIQEVRACTLARPLRQLFLRAKALELLALHAAAFLGPDPTPGLSEYDRERLQFARDYLTDQTQLPPSLPALARIAGLNECKLKRGFKAMFGLPVFAYLAEWRLQEARLRLAQPDVTVSEVAFELGFSSLQHFSGAFRKRFGVSPRELRAG